MYISNYKFYREIIHGIEKYGQNIEELWERRPNVIFAKYFVKATFLQITPQCGNFGIYLSFRFYVKFQKFPLIFYVKSILVIFRISKEPFSAIFDILNFDFGEFRPSENAKKSS